MDKRKSFLQLSERQKRRRLASVAYADSSTSLSEVDVINHDIDVDVTNHDIYVESRNVENELVAEESENESSSVIETSASCLSQERMDEIEDNDVNLDTDENVNMEIEENINIDDKKNLVAKLCDWALLFGISHVALTALLMILRISLPDEQLPKDARTLLRTPRKTVIRKVSPGNYFHYGLLKGIMDQLKNHMNHSGILDKIYIDIGIDGLPIAKSSRSQLWPILGRISNTVVKWNPFVIGILYIYTIFYIFKRKAFTVIARS
jgi:hypothetical protein